MDHPLPYEMFRTTFASSLARGMRWGWDEQFAEQVVRSSFPMLTYEDRKRYVQAVRAAWEAAQQGKQGEEPWKRESD